VALKSLSELLEGDDRQRMFGSAASLHESLAGIELLSSVPQHVRTLFDTARNLSLCTWYVYEFHPIAELTGFLALEAALKARAKEEGAALLATESSFRELIEHAVEAGWIAERRMANRVEIARARIEDRNALASIKLMDELGVDSVGVEEPTPEQIAAEERGMKILEDTCKAAVDLKNRLAHGEVMLAPGSYRRLRTTADLINQLFRS